MTLTPVGVVLIGIGFLIACLLAIYLYSIQINSRSKLSAVESEKKNEIEGVENLNLLTNESNSKKNKKKSKDKENSRNQKELSSGASETSQVISPADSSESFAKFDDEDDILALAILKGYDTSGIRRRSPEKSKFVEPIPVVVEAKLVNLKTTTKEKEKIKGVTVEPSENGSSVVETFKATEIQSITQSEIPLATSNEVCSESSVSVVVEEWSHVPTREEEITKNLKNKLSVLENEIEESERKLLQNSRLLEQSQRKIDLLEQELKEQRKIFNNTKTTLEAQITSLRATNHEMAGKLMIVEADALNASLFKNESDRAKEANSRLQADLRRVQDEKAEFFRQLTELKTENGFLREQAYLADSLNEKYVALEEELEEVRRQMELQVETSQTELKLTRAKLESEIAFHRAEHANSVGSSTALHQEISQLKTEINNLIESENNSKLKVEEFEKLNSQLLHKIEEFESQATKSEFSLKTEIEEIKNSLLEANKNIQSKNIEISTLQNELKTAQNYNETLKSKSTTFESEIESLKSEISNLNSQMIEKEKELAVAKSEIIIETSDSTEISTLRDQLAEAEIKISGLQSDLAREIKRADISKKVYETKLAMLQNDKN